MSLASHPAILARCLMSLAVVLLTVGCSEEKPKVSVPADVQVSYQVAINRHEAEPILLGPDSQRAFVDMVNGPEHDFDPKFLELSAEMGYFEAGNLTFEYHHGLVVLRRDDHIYIWTSDWVKQFMPLAVGAYEDPAELTEFLQR